MAINQEIISTSWEGQQKSYIEAGLKTLLQRMLEVLESPLAANSVGSNQLTQALRDAINSIGSKVPNTRTVNSKELSSNITIGPDDIMVGNQTLSAVLEDIGQGGDTSGLASRIAALESALNSLTGAEDTTQIIDTFNEVIDFLANVNNNETLLSKLQQLQTQINSKANDNAVVKSISVNGQTPQTPTNGNVNIQVQGGAQGPKGDTGNVQVDGNGNVLIVNSLDEGGTGAAFSAEMGKRVAGREATDRQRIDAIVAILKKSVFTDDQSAAIAALDALANATDSISLDKSSYLFNGISGTLTLTVSTDPAGKSVTWSSSNTSVATVNNGVVTPIAEGSTIITATSGGKTATCTVTVQAFVVDSVTIDQSDATYNGEIQGTTHQLSATTSPANGAVLWSSSNTSVATINETTGLLSVVGNGQTTITATDATREKTSTITVTVSNIVVPSITLNQNTITSNGEDVGDTHQLTATLVPNTDTVEEWSSSDSSVATVDNTGLVTIVGNGDCTITATSSRGLSATCDVTVSNVQTQFIDFEGDTVAKRIVLANYPHSNPNEITKQEAAAVTTLLVDPNNTGTASSPFQGTNIVNANWLQWFTGIYQADDLNYTEQYAGFNRQGKIFKNCASLESIIIPEGIQRLGSDCFETSWTSLNDVTLPSTIRSITVRGVCGKGILTVKAHSWDDNGTTKVPGLSGGVYLSTHFAFTKIRVPADSVNDYKTIGTWANYASIIEAIPE